MSEYREKSARARRLEQDDHETGRPYRRRVHTLDSLYEEEEDDDAYADDEAEYDEAEYEEDGDEAEEYEPEADAARGVKSRRNGDASRGRGKKRSSAPLIVILLLVLATVIAGGIFFFLMQKPERKLPGVWRAEIDLTESVRAEAESWLAAAESGDRISIRETMGEIRVGVILTLNADGSWSQSVDTASYEEASDAAYAALSEGLRELLLLRIEAAGREAGSAEEAEALIAETIGMSTEEYLRTYGPALLPPEEEFRSAYEGGGTYTAEGNVLQRDETEEYLVSEDMLVITGGGETQVYHRVQ